jgi:hypothetical protein
MRRLPGEARRAKLGRVAASFDWQASRRLGAIAQLGERLLCKQEVVGSIPSGSTSGDPDRLDLSIAPLVRE